MKTRKILLALSLAGALLVGGACGDPHACGPNDIDGDGDGKCNES